MAEMRSLFDDPQDDLRKLSFEELEAQAKTCTRCRLKGSRTNVVFGEGPVPCDLMFIGEAPGEVEDQLARPFVGPAGKKLDEILAAVGIQREEVYITNTVKCRPPGNRLPQKDEMEACWPYLEAQIYHLKPKIIVTLGNAPTQLLLKTQEGITKLRGQFFPWRRDIEVFPMFHPSYLLRNPSKAPGSPKYLTWQDIKRVKARLDELRKREQ
jgi:DNA polymerase